MSYHHINKVPPSFFFLLMLLFFQLLPTVFIYVSDYYTQRWLSLSINEYSQGAVIGILSIIIFLCFFIIGYISTNFLPKKVSKLDLNSPFIFYSNAAHFFILFLTLLSILFTLYHISFGGLNKLFLLGSDIDKIDYRVYGAEDRDRSIMALLQVSRRLILPFSSLYFYMLYRLSGFYKYKVYSLFSFVFLLSGSIVTLDRGPILLIVIMICFYFYTFTNNRLLFFSKLIPIFTLILVFFGVLSYIQHNILTFSFDDILDSSLHFFLKRIFLATSTVPIELSYGIFDLSSDKLYGQYSRLFAFFSGSYHGFSNNIENFDASLYVSPVGIFADIWRNFGFSGLIFIGFLFGLIFNRFDVLSSKLGSVVYLPYVFTILSFVFYLLYGVLFSQGVFLQLSFLLLFTNRRLYSS